jgi:hypothetical protein
MRKLVYKRETADKQYAAWYVKDPANHNFYMFSFTPSSLCGSGTPYTKEAEAKRAVDYFMDVRVPAMQQLRQLRRPFQQPACTISQEEAQQLSGFYSGVEA